MFVDTLTEIRNGGALIDMEESLERVVQAVRDTGKAGSITLTLAVKPAMKGNEVDMVFLQDTIKSSIPQPTKKETVFFVSPDNKLSRHDKRQLSMLDGLREINVQPMIPKEVK